MNFNPSTSALMTWAVTDRLSGSCEKLCESTTKQLQGVSKESTVPSWMLFRHLSQPPHSPQGVRLESLVDSPRFYRRKLSQDVLVFGRENSREEGGSFREEGGSFREEGGSFQEEGGSLGGRLGSFQEEGGRK